MTTFLLLAVVAILYYWIGTCAGYRKGYDEGYASSAIDHYLAEHGEQIQAAKEGLN